MRGTKVCVIAFLFIFIVYANTLSKEVKTMGGFQLSSPAFKNNDHIPSKYTCEGSDINPPLTIANTPAQAKTLALIVDDPEAPMGTWVHWIVWNISPQAGEIKENAVPGGAQQGFNDFRKNDYGGPCPPSGTHRYFFKLYALDTKLQLSTKAKKADLEMAMKGHILAETQLIGLYKRR